MEDDGARLFDAVFKLMRLFGRQFRQTPDSYHMTPTQYQILGILSEHATVTLLEIAGLLQVAAPTATRAVDALEQKGLLVKDRDPQDRRIVWLRLTMKGQGFYVDERAMRLARFQQWAARLTADEQEVLRKLLDKLAEEDQQA